MGEGHSKDGEEPASHTAKDNSSFSEAQRGKRFLSFSFFFNLSPPLSLSLPAFNDSFKSEDKQTDSFPLFLIRHKDRDFKYMDTRPKVDGEVEDGKILLEMFWEGSLENVDTPTFQMIVAETLMKYGAKQKGDLVLSIVVVFIDIDFCFSL
jgi:hypothetical protein